MLHQESNIVVETAQVLKFALDIAKGMAFIHSLERLVPNLYLSSKHVMVSWVCANEGCHSDSGQDFGWLQAKMSVTLTLNT